MCNCPEREYSKQREVGQEQEAEVYWFILCFSLCKEVARRIKLPEERQKNRAQRSNKK